MNEYWIGRTYCRNGTGFSPTNDLSSDVSEDYFHKHDMLTFKMISIFSSEALKHKRAQELYELRKAYRRYKGRAPTYFDKPLQKFIFVPIPLPPKPRDLPSCVTIRVSVWWFDQWFGLWYWTKRAILDLILEILDF